MLSQLYIENIAVIEKAGIDFLTGLNVLTGETGAGKSIVIDSINAILGERTSRELVRTGARSAFVSAVFIDLGVKALSKLTELGYSCEEDGTVMIQREIHLDGKAVCRINGRPATVSVLKEIGSLLISIHAVFKVTVEPRLRTVILTEIVQKLFWCTRKLQFLRNTLVVFPF